MSTLSTFKRSPVRAASRLLRTLVVLSLAAAGLIGGTASMAASHGGPPPAGPGSAMSGSGPGEGRGGLGMVLISGRGLDRLLDRIEANPEQRAQIRRLTGAARDDLRAIRQEGRGLREQMRAAWSRPTLDEAEIERLRQQGQAQQDRVSRRITQSLLEVGRVLSPAQRQQLAQLARSGPRMDPRRGDGRRGPGEGPMRHRQGAGPDGAPGAALHDE